MLCHIPPKGFSLDISASKILSTPKMGKKYNKELMHKFKRGNKIAYEVPKRYNKVPIIN